MKICTCNNCGNVYEDTNPSMTSVDYPDSLPLKKLSVIELVEYEDVNIGYGCPICKTDGYLMDNLNENVGGMANIINQHFLQVNSAGYSVDDFDWSKLPINY